MRFGCSRVVWQRFFLGEQQGNLLYSLSKQESIGQEESAGKRRAHSTRTL
jgi:hypothetical protein